MKSYKYYAFISYSHKDSEWAKWLQNEFEQYQLPATLSNRKDLPTSFYPIFRDEDELSGGELKPQISEALHLSNFLIVVCSPNSAQSDYVNNEIKEFIEIGKERGTDNKRKIFPFIIDGKPHPKAGDENSECFAPILLDLGKDKTDPIELIAGDVSATGRNHAFVKILAGSLRTYHILFSELWDKYEASKIAEEERKKQEREKLLISNARFISEKALSQLEGGNSYLVRRVILELYGNRGNEYPYVAEADRVFRRAIKEDSFTINMERSEVVQCAISNSGHITVVATYDSVSFYSSMNGQLLGVINDINCCAYTQIHFILNDNVILISTSNSVKAYQVDNLELIDEWALPKNKHRSKKFFYQGPFIIKLVNFNKARICVATDTGELYFINIRDLYRDNSHHNNINNGDVRCSGLFEENSKLIKLDYTNNPGNSQLLNCAIHNNKVILAFSDGKLRILNIEDGKISKKTISNNEDFSVNFTKDKYITVSKDKSVIIYSLSTLRKIHTFEIPCEEDEYVDNAYTDGRILIITLLNVHNSVSKVRYYLLEKEQLLHYEGMHISESNNIMHLCFDIDMSHVVYRINDGRVKHICYTLYSVDKLASLNSGIVQISPVRNKQKLRIKTKDMRIADFDLDNENHILLHPILEKSITQEKNIPTQAELFLQELESKYLIVDFSPNKKYCAVVDIYRNNISYIDVAQQIVVNSVTQDIGIFITGIHFLTDSYLISEAHEVHPKSWIRNFRV